MLDALTLDQMRTFAAVAEAGSFRAGATRLRRVQSAVSHAIGNLEAQLGVSLFDRSGHRPTLTVEGRVLLDDVRAILLKVDTLRARAHGLGEGVELKLSIVVDTLFPIATTGAALKEMHETYPSVTVRMAVTPLGGPLAALREGGYTLGVTVGENFRDPHIAFEALSCVPFIAVVAPTHPLAKSAYAGEPLSAAMLADHLQIVQEDPTPLSEGRDFGVLSPGTWRVSGQDTKQALILAGLGWGRLPSWAVERDLAEGRLVRVPSAEFGPQGETLERGYLMHRADTPLGPAARSFRQALLRLTGNTMPQEKGNSAE